jgi:hypothetical protein
MAKSYSALKETLAVGMAAFSGSIDLRDIFNRRESLVDNISILDITQGDMNKNDRIMSSLAISLRIPDSPIEKNQIARLTLYAARLDFHIKHHKAKKSRAMEIVARELSDIDAEFICNDKTGNQFTITFYRLGRLKTIENVCEHITGFLSKSGDIDGVIVPDIVKLHVTGCCREQDIVNCASTLYKTIRTFGHEFHHTKTYNVMCNSTYSFSRRIRMKSLIKFLVKYTQDETLYPRIYLLYDNTRKPNSAYLLFRFDKEREEKGGIEAWREEYEVVMNIKSNGKVDQSSFSRKHAIITQERLSEILHNSDDPIFE